MWKLEIYAALLFISLRTASSVDTVITQNNCSTTTPNSCRYSDAICTLEGYCIGPASCTATDCSTGPICATGEECWQIYNTNTYRCCTWIGASSTGTNTTCLDLAAPGRPSDCPLNANLCQHSLYKTLMQRQCPKTCNYCTPTGSTTGTTCIDLAAAGMPSDCSANANLCNDPLYQTLMARQCPRTCGLCTIR